MGEAVGSVKIKPVRRGSSFSDKQVAEAVRNHRRVEIVLANSQIVSGYIYGGDDFHWGVVNPQGETFLVHKTAPMMHLLSITLGQEQSWVKEELEPIVTPYRDFIMRTVFSQKTPL